MNTTAATDTAQQETKLHHLLKRYLEELDQIDCRKQELKILLEEAVLIPGVNKKGFQYIAMAMHEAPGSIEERLWAIDDFIKIAFRTTAENIQTEDIFIE